MRLKITNNGNLNRCECQVSRDGPAHESGRLHLSSSPFSETPEDYIVCYCDSSDLSRERFGISEWHYSL